MHELEGWLLGVLGVVVVLGIWSVWWVRGNHSPLHSLWGGRIFIVTLVILGAGNLVCLTWAVHCLLPYGLSAGWLVIAMLWENPLASW
jgi:hypothetical protein